MSASKVFELYSRLPVPAQNIVCSLAGFKMRAQRYNRTFRNTLSLLQNSEWWSLERQMEHQNLSLRAIIQYAYKSVPYYRESFDQLGIKPRDIRQASDLTDLPLLTKDVVRQRWADLQSTALPESQRQYGYTGGTTGTALKLAFDRTTQPWQWAVWWRHRGRFGIRLNDPFIVFAGRDVVPLDNLRPPFWRRNLPMRQTYVSVHHLTKRNLPALADYLCQRHVVYYSGYPSALYLVASHFLETSRRLPHPPRMVFTGAETLLPHQRRIIAEAFSSKVSDQYGASEHCGNISECDQGSYHVDLEFGVVEFLPIPNLPPSVGRIVCTGLHNRAMPLIRYEIGDIATLDNRVCPCGRQAPVVNKIDGRIESYIITPDGRQLGRLDFLFKKSVNIVEAQLVQNQLERVTFKIVRGPNYGKADEERLLRDIRTYMGDSFIIDLQYLDEIPKDGRGKFRQIISSVFRDEMKAQRTESSTASEKHEEQG